MPCGYYPFTRTDRDNFKCDDFKPLKELRTKDTKKLHVVMLFNLDFEATFIHNSEALGTFDAVLKEGIWCGWDHPCWAQNKIIFQDDWNARVVALLRSLPLDTLVTLIEYHS
jgi:hypothetical protein